MKARRRRAKRSIFAQRRGFFVIGAATALLAIAILVAFVRNPGNKSAILVGVVGPMSGKHKHLGRSIRDGVQLLVEQINGRGGINGRRLTLVVKDDQNKVALARKRALEFAREGKVVAVIGHRYSGPTLAAKPIYIEYGIPTLAPTASNPKVTENSKVNFRMALDDNVQAELIAHYIKYVFNGRSVAVIRSESTYGESLYREFRREAERIGLSINGVFVRKKDTPFAVTEQLLTTLSGADFTLLSLHQQLAIEVMRELSDKNLPTRFIGGDAVGNQFFPRLGGKAVEGVYAISFYNPDIMGLVAMQFAKRFKKRFGYSPGWGAATAYDAMALLADALAKAGVSRSAIARHLIGLNSVGKSVSGVTGTLFFDSQGNSMKAPVFIRVRNGRFRAAEYQISYVGKTQALTNAERRETFLFKNYLMRKTVVVFTGVFVTQVVDFDVKKSQFTVELLLWFRWHGRRKTIAFNLIDGQILEQSLTASHVDKKTLQRYQCFKIRATITQAFTFYSYPFDTHTFRIKLRHKHLASNKLRFVNDLPDLDLKRRKVSFSNWDEKGQISFVEYEKVLTSFRDPRNADMKVLTSFPVYNHQITVKRVFSIYLLKFLLPLCFIVLMAFLVFFIHPQQLETNIAIGVTALLAAIAFHITQTENLPNIGYVVVADVFFMVAYAFIFLSIVETVITSRLHNAGRTDTALKLDLYCRFASLTVLPGSIALVIALMG